MPRPRAARCLPRDRGSSLVAVSLGEGRVSRAILAAVFIAAGILHFLLVDFYAGIVPDWLPAHRLLVMVSGVAEIAGGVGLLLQRTRRAAGWGLLLLLAAVWPANFQMFFAARTEDAPFIEQAILLARLPLQLVIAWWVWRAAGLHLHRAKPRRDVERIDSPPQRHPDTRP